MLLRVKISQLGYSPEFKRVREVDIQSRGRVGRQI